MNRRATDSVMEAATLKKKKNKEIKAKVKKTFKNVLSRPDPLFWPVVTEEQEKSLETVIIKYKVTIPEYKKPHWKELKDIPKEKRPKPPTIPKVKGLLFGISECCAAVEKGDCSGIIIESSTNPQVIAQPVIEACIQSKVPVLCMSGLRNMCLVNFGIKTSCLGVEKEYIIDLSEKISELGKDKLPQTINIDNFFTKNILVQKDEAVKMDTEETAIQNVYLYRTNKKTRVFVPPSSNIVSGEPTKFKGQNFIEFSDKLSKETEKRKYLQMVVKRMSSNQNRPKKGLKK